MLNLKTIVLGPIQTNCYIVYNTESLNTIIVDPSDDTRGRLADFITSNALKPVAILVTHAHFDHIGSVDELRHKYSIKAYSSKIEAINSADPKLNLGNTFINGINIKATIDEVLTDGQIVRLGDMVVKCIEVPGHSDQSLCYYIEEISSLISGDTVFAGDTGRTDLYHGPSTDLLKNIREKLFVLPGDTKVYPGHGPSTTISKEIKNSQYLY
ncbi:MAG: hydroxyacylglutathione hydrolase [Clostridiales bacterium]|jgi:glyoxylase-like metal-dependent hydrolase (beta-lactamase superfamily II)|nr:hydroxyacylglutathione hydrolase [Clostridiales bacterium]